MHRRSLLTLLGTSAAATAWPLAVRAQQGGIPRVGILRVADPADVTRDFTAELRQGLRDLGHVEGRSFVIESRWPLDGRLERLPELAADLVRLPVAVIVALGPQTIQ